MMRLTRFSLLSVLLFLALNTCLFAQKQKLEPEDYDQWQSISTTEISANGQWFAYNISLVDGDGWLIIKQVGADSTEDHKFMHGIRPKFSPNNKWSAFQIGVSEEKKKKLKKQKKKVRLKLGLMNLEESKVDTFKNVQSYSFSDNGRWLAMKKYKAEGVKTEGTDLILRNLQHGTNQLIGNVSDYAFNDDGSKLAVLLDANEKLGNGAHLYNLKSGKITVLDSKSTTYKKLKWNEDGTALAFLKEQENEAFKDPTHHIMAFKDLNQSPKKFVFDQQKINSFPQTHRVVDYRNLEWSEDGNTVFFGIKEWEKKKDKSAESDSTKKKSDDDLDPSNVEVWHWQDDDIQPKQKVMKNQLKQKNDLSAWHLDKQSFVRIGTKQFDQVQLTGNQQYAVAYDPHPYEPQFEEEWRDVYLVDVTTGETQQVLEQHEYVQTSPDGSYLLYFKDQNWWTYDIKNDQHRNITEDIDTRFENFTNVNGREHRRPFGAGEWSEEDDWVLLYDRYNVYQVWADGNNTKQLTNGNSDKIRYRQRRFNYDGEGIEDNDNIYFSMYGDETKDRGYARLNNNGSTQTLVYESKMYSRLAKADSTQKFVYQVETATDSPDFFHVDSNFSNPTRLTYTNPQQDDYYWADDQLVTFTNKNGQKLEGRLLYPANYDPDKKYPMITYIYEDRSQTLHNYSIPTKKSPYNFRRYSSEGYFVFQPDITYELSDPGISAVESVVPAVQKVIDTGMINKDQIGLTGHSWGAYQTTFIVTQTDLFNSAVAGAPLTNMISMYNSIYWNTGTTDANIFETSQGRFPDPWWKDWDNFIENSPIFNMQQMNTPLLVEFGTDDGAVDFNQGVELYNTMRRMQNPFVMLVYEGENHGLAREENQIDYATRAFEWHEHYLLGKEAPAWITDGLPFLERPAIEEKEEK
ncbi:Dipeptidyl aminopeptidase/acylaminoacyl peptidase [Fodinibius salinus]|uniref:Dipeptidyl aminopeptidase/acylaminoacyl peptidase n=1 Tax=Fodinibius salinus TaxID=860790 RepID=A0A5D3YJ02_9BACT|nr:prolyl oligopeptidase family serine peptidase [Fodinibius salinus]TYP92220.1 Dipeptidyl aminopeptidase/acylaminoacyl peptidase [Fodinibius salinus]